MAVDNNSDDYAFDLTGEGEGGFFRVRMPNVNGERNRHVMHDTTRGKRFLVIATLLDVAHGKLAGPASDDATLLIANFRFLPSGGKRFSEATITWTFESDDPGLVEVSVFKVAPDGAWGLNPTTLGLEKSVAVNAGINAPGGGPVAGNLGGEYRRAVNQELVYHTSVDGTPRKLGEGGGDYDSARWHLVENKADRRGICRVLQAAVLLRHTTKPGRTLSGIPAPLFRGAVDITVQKGDSSLGVRDYFERVWKKTKPDEAILFQHGTDRVSGDFDDLIDRENLGATDLEEIMKMSLFESFDDFKREKKEMRNKRVEEKKRFEEEEREKKRLEEDEKKKREEEMKRKEEDLKSEEDRRRHEEEMNRHKTHAPEESTSHEEQRGRTPIGPGTTDRISINLAMAMYVVLGILLMYVWRKLSAMLG